jgi:thymidylate synthase
LWILRGSTDVKELADVGVHVWDANTSRKALDSYGFADRPEYDLGPTYGFNLRHFGEGTNYSDKSKDYSGKGKD